MGRTLRLLGWGGFPIYYNIIWREGSTATPIFLRNKWTAPQGFIACVVILPCFGHFSIGGKKPSEHKVSVVLFQIIAPALGLRAQG